MYEVVCEFSYGNYIDYHSGSGTWSKWIKAAFTVNEKLAREISELAAGLHFKPKRYCFGKGSATSETSSRVSSLLLEEKEDIRLSKDNHNTLMSLLNLHLTLWKKLAVAFGIPLAKVKDIEHSEGHSGAWHCMNKMISELLCGNHDHYDEFGSFTWNRLITAVFEVDEELAQKISGEISNSSR